MFCTANPKNNQTRKRNNIKLVFTRISTRKNKEPLKTTNVNVQKHRALNNLVKYLKHIENDKSLMNNVNNRNYLSQDKIHINELQNTLKQVNNSLNNANKKVLNIGEIVNNNVKEISDTQNEIKRSLNHKI